MIETMTTALLSAVGDPMPPNQVLFVVLAVIAVGSALGVVLFPSPVRSALALVLTLFSLAMIYFTLGAEFLGITQIMVYAGAIMVLFLFVIMILRTKPQETDIRRIEGRQAAGFLLAAVIFAAITALIFLPIRAAFTNKVDDAYGAPQTIGTELFTTYAVPFIVASILLLVGVVGSVMLAKKRF